MLIFVAINIVFDYMFTHILVLMHGYTTVVGKRLSGLSAVHEPAFL